MKLPVRGVSQFSRLNTRTSLVGYRGRQKEIPPKPNPKYYVLEDVKFPQYFDVETDMHPRVFEVVGPNMPKELKIMWKESGEMYKVIKGDPICRLIDKEGYKTFLYAPCNGELREKFVKNYDTVNCQVICKVKEQFPIFKKKCYELRVPFLDKVGQIQLTKGVGEIVHASETVAVLYVEGRRTNIIAPEGGIISAIHAVMWGTASTGQRICDIKPFSNWVKSKIIKRHEEHMEHYGHDVGPPLDALAFTTVNPPPPTKIKEDENLHVTSSGIMMAKCIELVTVISTIHNLKPRLVLDCIYIIASRNLLRLYPELSVPPKRMKWHNNSRIDISIGVMGHQHFMSHVFPTVSGVNKLSLLDIYNKLLSFTERFQGRVWVEEPWADPNTFTICNLFGYDVAQISPCLNNTAFVALTCNDIMPTPVFLKTWSGKNKIKILPVMKASLCLNAGFRPHVDTCGEFLTKFKAIMETPAGLI